tara:strand:+ start:2806 stop:3003 length:198 start_codon:yes stop_codon:yes gene_type:complete
MPGAGICKDEVPLRLARLVSASFVGAISNCGAFVLAIGVGAIGGGGGGDSGAFCENKLPICVSLI